MDLLDLIFILCLFDLVSKEYTDYVGQLCRAMKRQIPKSFTSDIALKKKITSDASVSASSVWYKILNTIQSIKIQNSASAFNYVGNSHLVRHFVMCTSQHLLQSNITVL